MTIGQKSSAQTYRWACHCGHTYFTTANVPGECPLHLAAPDLLAALKALADRTHVTLECLSWPERDRAIDAIAKAEMQS